SYNVDLCPDQLGATIGHFPMRRTRSARPVLLLLGIALLRARAASGAPQVDSQYGPLPVFELHSGFWINLHHTLYLQARQSRDDRAAPSVVGAETHRTASERQAW